MLLRCPHPRQSASCPMKVLLQCVCSGEYANTGLVWVEGSDDAKVFANEAAAARFCARHAVRGVRVVHTQGTWDPSIWRELATNRLLERAEKSIKESHDL